MTVRSRRTAVVAVATQWGNLARRRRRGARFPGCEAGTLRELTEAMTEAMKEGT
jgi:hypothetical protein